MNKRTTMYIIIRHNPVTNHRYVLTDGRNDRVFRDAQAATLEARRIQGWGSAHGVEIYGCFDSTRQAREYCRLMGEGMSKADAIQLAKETFP